MPTLIQELENFVSSELRSQQTVAEIYKKMSTLEAAVFGQNQVVDLIPTRLEKLTQALEDQQSTVRLLERAGENEAKLLDRHYEERVVEPLVRGLIQLYDMINEAWEKFQEAPDSQTKGILSLLDTLKDTFEQFFFIYSVEIFRSPVGTPFDRQTMRTIRTEPTSNRDHNQTVARVLRSGAQRLGRVLRPQSIILYRYERVLKGPDVLSDPPRTV